MIEHIVYILFGSFIMLASQVFFILFFYFFFASKYQRDLEDTATRAGSGTIGTD